ncbi:hypothetical protein BKI51_22050 [Alphaproteobacteria bacterium AO1-B]|nr:hypothetical protein BKI51_22050 [Alphaproteobacteria bacterium AO1-B]
MRPTKKASTQTPEASTDPQLWDHDKTMPHHRYGVKEYFPISLFRPLMKWIGDLPIARVAPAC